MLVLNELSDEEIERICAAPRVTKQMVFGAAEAWLERNKKDLERDYGGRYLCIDARTLIYRVGDTDYEALDQHYGPVGRDGRVFVCVYVRPCS